MAMADLVNRGSGVVALSAYLVREACGLGDDDQVVLTAGAETVRKMSLNALEDVRGVFRAISRLGRENKRMRAILEEIQWSASSVVGKHPCPVCQGEKPVHAADCKLYEVITND